MFHVAVGCFWEGGWWSGRGGARCVSAKLSAKSSLFFLKRKTTQGPPALRQRRRCGVEVMRLARRRRRRSLLSNRICALLLVFFIWFTLTPVIVETIYQKSPARVWSVLFNCCQGIKFLMGEPRVQLLQSCNPNCGFLEFAPLSDVERRVCGD